MPIVDPDAVFRVGRAVVGVPAFPSCLPFHQSRVVRSGAAAAAE